MYFNHHKSHFHHAAHLRHKSEMNNKSWHFFKWEVWVILIAMLIVAFLNVIPNWFVDEVAGKATVSEKYFLRNNITFSSISVFLTIGVAIFIGVFTEMGKYVGKFGSAIFILVPALLWLFSERGEEQEGLERVVEAMKQASDIVFWITIGCIGTFAIGIIIYHFVIINILNLQRKERFEYWNNFAYRIMLLVVNILIVLMMAYALISYALFSLHLGDLTPVERHKIALEESIPESEVYPIVFHNDRIVVFHSVVTAFFSILMVLIGLTNFVKEAREKAKEAKLGELEKVVNEDPRRQAKIEKIKNDLARRRPIAIAQEENTEIGAKDV